MEDDGLGTPRWIKAVRVIFVDYKTIARGESGIR
jgi:hypothetical protein